AAERARVIKAISKDEAAFSIGINDFDGFTGHGNLDITRLLGLAARHVLGSADNTDHFDFRLEQSNSAHGTDHGRATGHVIFHLLHTVSGLDGDSTGIEGNAFAHQPEHWLFRCALRFIAHHDEARLFVRALGNAPERAHLQLFDLVRTVGLTLEAHTL